MLMQPDNHSKKYENLFMEIDKGNIKLPMFQRDFVWEKERTSSLIDSILKGFPIGTFILWKTRESLRSYKNIGNFQLNEPPKGDYVQYILDGQQRITSLYAIRKGIRISKDGKEVDYRDIYIDLNQDPHTDEQIVVVEKSGDQERFVSVHDVLTKHITDFLDFYDRETTKRIEYYKTTLTNYDFSTILINEYPIEIACEVFSRINTGGKVLTVFEIMVAKTYDEKRDFDLSEKYELLCDGSDESDKSLRKAGYETISEAVVMQCVSALCKRAVRKKDILKISREDFIDLWDDTCDSIYSAIDFLRTELNVLVSQLVPYPALLVPLAYFFYKIKNKKCTNKQKKLLEQFFYWAGINERYSSSSESKIAEDLIKIDSIVKGYSPKYTKNDLYVDAETIALTRFSTSNAYCKTILCLLASNKPRSFDSGGTVILDNSNLKIASSRNYHHFFPKKYLQDKNSGFEPNEPNLIANITLIDGYSNKYRIGKKAPSDYLGKFKKTNKELPEILKDHLIDDIKIFGIISNDYPKFISQRSFLIANKLNEKLNPRIVASRKK